MKQPVKNSNEPEHMANDGAAKQVENLCKLGLEIHRKGRLAHAQKVYEDVLNLQPNHFDALHMLGVIAAQAENYLQAVELIDRAIEINPDYAEAYFNRGIVLQDLQRPDDALASYDQAINLKPDYGAAYNNHGNALHDLNRLEEALASYDQAISLIPDDAAPHQNRCQCCLLMGDFERGWEGLEWRWKEARLEKSKRDFTQPLWLGRESLAGRTILLHSELGYGDTLQFCRYAKEVSDLGARVIMEVHKPLLGLLKNLDGVSQLLANGSALPAFDYHCPLMSLPLAFKTDLTTIPAHKSYIASNPNKVAAWRNRLGAKTKPRVGLAWSGNPDNMRDRHRSIELAVMRSLLCTEIEWFSLHREVRDSDAELLSSNTDIRHFGGQMDFDETAAVIELMDLVVSVDTSIAHLAGAMGKPVWILLPFRPDWRWLLDRDDSPWYPSARLFRQDKIGDWATVMQNVQLALETWIGEPFANG